MLPDGLPDTHYQPDTHFLLVGHYQLPDTHYLPDGHYVPNGLGLPDNLFQLSGVHFLQGVGGGLQDLGQDGTGPVASSFFVPGHQGHLHYLFEYFGFVFLIFFGGHLALFVGFLYIFFDF